MLGKLSSWCFSWCVWYFLVMFWQNGQCSCLCLHQQNVLMWRCQFQCSSCHLFQAVATDWVERAVGAYGGTLSCLWSLAARPRRAELCSHHCQLCALFSVPFFPHWHFGWHWHCDFLAGNAVLIYAWSARFGFRIFSIYGTPCHTGFAQYILSLSTSAASCLAHVGHHFGAAVCFQFAAFSILDLPLLPAPPSSQSTCSVKWGLNFLMSLKLLKL